MLPRKKTSSPLLLCSRQTLFHFPSDLSLAALYDWSVPGLCHGIYYFSTTCTVSHEKIVHILLTGYAARHGIHGVRWHRYVWSLSINFQATCKKVHSLNAEYEQKDVSVSVCVSGAEHKRPFSLLGRLSDHDLPCITHRPWSPTVADFIMHDSKNAWGMI